MTSSEMQQLTKKGLLLDWSQPLMHSNPYPTP